MAEMFSNAKEAGYVAIGFALLGFQRVQVRRRDLEKELRRVFAKTCPRQEKR